MQQVTQDEGALTRFLLNSSPAVTAIAEKRNDLADLVTNTNNTASAIGSENVALARALGLLPTTLRRANTTFVNLRATLDDLDVLVAASKPATKNLAPFLRQLRPLLQRRRAGVTTCARYQHARPEQRPGRRDAQVPALAERGASPAFRTAARR